MLFEPRSRGAVGLLKALGQGTDQGAACHVCAPRSSLATLVPMASQWTPVHPAEAEGGAAFLSERALAWLLDVSTATVRRWRYAKKGPAWCRLGA